MNSCFTEVSHETYQELKKNMRKEHVAIVRDLSQLLKKF